MKLIDKDALKLALLEQGLKESKEKWGEDWTMKFSQMVNVIESVPVLDTDAVDFWPRAEWIRAGERLGHVFFRCSCCEKEEAVPTIMGDPIWSWCPNCGAEMKGGKE